MKKLIICNKNLDKKKIKKLIEWHLNIYGNIKTSKLLDKIKKIGFHFSTIAGISLGQEDLILIKEKTHIIKKNENILKKNLLKLESGKINKQQYIKKIIDTWTTIDEILKEEIFKNFRQTNLFNPVFIMISSGARGNILQIKQIIGIRGLMSDSKGNIIELPIKSNLKEGLNSEEYFISCYGARKGVIDTALKTANSGYLTRKLIYVSQNIYIKQSNCNLKTGRIIKILNSNKKNFLETKEAIIGKIINENIKSKKTQKIFISKGQDICNYLASKIIKNIKYIIIRSPLTCNNNTGICQLCYGWDLNTNKIINLGEAIGILAAQSIGEPGTQLTMRTFHTGGIFKNEKIKTIKCPEKGIIIYSKKNLKKITNKYGLTTYLTNKQKYFFLKNNQNYILKINIPKLSLIFIKPLQLTFNKQIIAEIPKWNKKHKELTYTQEEKSKNNGQIKNIFKKNRRKIWLINGVLINPRKNIVTIKKTIQKNNTKKQYKKTKLKKIKLNYKTNFKIKKIKSIKKKEYQNYKKYIINILKNKEIFCKNTKNLKRKIKNEKNKLGSFIKKNKLKMIKYNGIIIELYKNRITIKKSIPICINKNTITKIKNNQIIKKNQKIISIKYTKQKNKDIIEGLPKIENILEARNSNNNNKKLKKYIETYKKFNKPNIANEKATTKIQKEIIKKVQNVYKSQNIEINDKHLEIIIKEMTSKAIITENNKTNFINGEIIETNKINKLNINYEPIILGISKISLSKNSFISSACFQETTRILTKSAIMGKIDWLTGIKENIILGNLIPTGTSFNNLK